MLIGNWKNIEELEDSLTLEELKLILDSYRKQEMRNHKFFAALKGIDLDKEQAKDAEAEFLRVKQKVDARLSGMNEEEFEMRELGFEIETEE